MRSDTGSQVLFFIPLAALLSACGGGDTLPMVGGGGGGADDCSVTTASVAATTGGPVTGTSFAYQLQNADPAAIGATNFQIMVMDYSRDGTEATKYSPAQLQSLHAAGKKVLAYVSIGEAESYRYYFSSSWLSHNAPSASAPCWLGHVDPDWVGNFAVRYWSEDWQQTMLGYVDKVMAQGFDGVYLDKVDEFEYWSDPANGEGERLGQGKAAQYMIAFVKRIADHARNAGGVPGFLVMPQNGEDLLPYDTDGSYLQAISGMGIEDLIYDGLTPVSSAEVSFRESLLDQIRGAGRTVLVTDYVDDGSGYMGANAARITDFRNKVTGAGYLPYAALQDRALDSLNLIPGVQD